MDTESITPTANGPDYRVNIDPVEYCRGQIAAMSFIREAAAREVHILSIRKSFERAGILSSLRYALAVLDLMREVQELGQGYWYPTPLRRVLLDGRAILVGIPPTNELRRNFQTVRRAGYARLVDDSEVRSIPIQELDEWTLRERDTVAWTKCEVAKARSAIGPTMTSRSLEFFGILSRAIGGRRVLLQNWTSKADSGGMIASEGLVLCRERIANTYYRHFFAILDGRRVSGEAPLQADLNRLKFGLAKLAGSPITVLRSTDATTRSLRVFGDLPRAERTLLLALGKRQSARYGRTYSFHEADYSAHLEDVIQHLGCEVKDWHA